MIFLFILLFFKEAFGLINQYTDFEMLKINTSNKFTLLETFEHNFYIVFYLRKNHLQCISKCSLICSCFAVSYGEGKNCTLYSEKPSIKNDIKISNKLTIFLKKSKKKI